MLIIQGAERRRQPRGVKMLIAGIPGVGKTSLLRTLDLSSTLFIDCEAGDLAIADLDVDTFAPRTWQECRDLACYIGGPNPALAPDACYSQAHYNAVVDRMGSADALDKYQTIFVDSLTVASRLCWQWCAQQPEAFSHGKKDPRGTYGLLGREMVAWLSQLQHTRHKNVIFLCILERKTDDIGRISQELQIEGGKTGRELPGIVDQIVTMANVDFGDGKPIRAFVCTPENSFGYPAKDRRGVLDEFERPHLGELLAKLVSDRPRHEFSVPDISKSENANANLKGE